MRRRHRKAHRVVTLVLGLVSAVVLALAIRARMDRPVPAPFDLEAEAGHLGADTP